MNEATSDNCFVYVIGTETKQKIGFSRNPETRLQQLQTGNHEKLEVHATIEVLAEDAHLLEKHIHKDISYKRLKGEWFGLTKKEAIDYFAFVEMRWASDVDQLKYKI